MIDEERKLYDIEKNIEKISSKRVELINEIKQLEEIDVVKRYIDITKENEDLYNKQNKLIKEYQELKQEICKHGIWYYLKSEEDEYERRTYVECKCIKCGIEKTFRSREIKNIGTVIQEDFYEKCLNSYKEVVKFYNGLLGFSMENKDVNKLMVKRFNNQKTNK